MFFWEYGGICIKHEKIQNRVYEFLSISRSMPLGLKQFKVFNLIQYDAIFIKKVFDLIFLSIRFIQKIIGSGRF